MNRFFGFFKALSRKSAFSYERVVARLLASWAIWIAASLGSGDFTVLAFGQSVSWTSVFPILGCFILLSVFAALLGKVHTDSWALFLFALICGFEWLLSYDGENTVLFLLAVFAAEALFGAYFLNRNEELLSRFRLPSWAVATVAVLLAVICGGGIALVTVLRYKTFSSPNFDFGLFCNMFYNMKESGLPMATSERDRLLSHFAVHISPVYYLLLPFYWLFPTPETLQIGQAVVVALGVLPVYLLARKKNLSPIATVVVCAMYALYPALSGGCFYDLHENCFLSVLLLFTFYFFEAKKPIPMYLFAVLMLSVKEDAAVYLLIFALYLLLSRRSFLHGGILAGLSLCYFALCAFLLNEYGLGMMVNRFDNLIYEADGGLLGAVKTALVNPGYLLTQLFTTSKDGFEKLTYAVLMFLPVCGIPFLTKKPARWILVAPILFNLLTMYQYQYDVEFQYHFGITAFLIYATVLNLPELSVGIRRKTLGFGLIAVCFAYTLTVVPQAETYWDRWNRSRSDYAEMEIFLDQIPEDASVTCSTMLLAHLSDRDVIYEVAYHEKKTDTEYVVLDERYSNYKEYQSFYLSNGYRLQNELEKKIVILQKDE